MKIYIAFFIGLLCLSAYAQESKTIEVGTYNIRFFPCNQNGEMMKTYGIEMRYPPQGTATDTTALFNILKQLDIELLGVEEIVDPPLFGAMAKRHLGESYEFIYAPSDAWQKVGFLYDSSELELIGDPLVFWEVALGKPDRHRPALAAYFRSIPEGYDFYAVVVHLKSSPRGTDQREEQWSFLEKILNDLPSGPQNDHDIILLGDFNNVSPAGYKEFLPRVKGLNFHWMAEADTSTITSYWQPDWKKQELKGSGIDQIFISDDATAEYVPASFRIGGICGEQVESISGDFPDYYNNVSDHCPVFISFKVYPDND